jgi:hypothetical protein
MGEFTAVHAVTAPDESQCLPPAACRFTLDDFEMGDTERRERHQCSPGRRPHDGQRSETHEQGPSQANNNC